MVKKLILILAAHSCDRSDSSCQWQKRLMDVYPPIIKHGNREDGPVSVFYADVFDKQRIAEIMGIPLKKPGRKKGSHRGPYRVGRNKTSVIVNPEALRGVDPKSIQWPSEISPSLKAEILAIAAAGHRRGSAARPS